MQLDCNEFLPRESIDYLSETVNDYEVMNCKTL